MGSKMLKGMCYMTLCDRLTGAVVQASYPASVSMDHLIDEVASGDGRSVKLDEIVTREPAQKRPHGRMQQPTPALRMHPHIVALRSHFIDGGVIYSN